MKNLGKGGLAVFLFLGAVLGNVLLMANNLSNGIVWLHILSALLLAVIAFKTSKDVGEIQKWEAGRKNIKEAQRLLQEKPYGIFKYVSRKTVFGHEGLPTYSTDGVLEEPFVWLLCMALYAAVFFSSAYLEFDPTNVKKVLKLAFYSMFQMVLLAAAFFGILTVVTRKFKGAKK